MAPVPSKPQLTAIIQCLPAWWPSAETGSMETLVHIGPTSADFLCSSQRVKPCAMAHPPPTVLLPWLGLKEEAGSGDLLPLTLHPVGDFCLQNRVAVTQKEGQKDNIYSGVILMNNSSVCSDSLAETKMAFTHETMLGELSHKSL